MMRRVVKLMRVSVVGLFLLVMAGTSPAFADTGVAGTDAAMDAATDAGSDAAMDAGADSGADAAMDAAADAAADAAGDASMDTSTDAAADVAPGVIEDGGGGDVGDDVGADVGDAGDTGMPTDAGDTGDAEGDTSAMTDADMMDVATDAAMDVASDATADATGDAAVGDVEVDTGPASFRFSGRVDVVDRRDDSGVQITVTRPDDDSFQRQRTTDTAGRFNVASLEAGEYRVEVTLDGYVDVVDSFELQGDRVAYYELFTDQTADLEVVVSFAEGTEPPQTVQLALEGARGSREPEMPVSVADGRASWTVESLGAGSWTLEADAEGFQAAAVPFELRGDDESPPKLRVRVELNVPGTVDVRPTDEEGCSCRLGDGGGTPNEFPVAVIVLIVGSAVLRSRKKA